MPQEAQVVDVPGLGPVEFPASMSTADISKAASRLYQRHVNDQLTAANAKPLQSPTTYEGGRNQSLLETAAGVGRGLVNSVRNLPAGMVDAVRTAADVADLPQAAITSLVRGKADPVIERMKDRVVGAGRMVRDVASGDPEAGGEALGNLGMALVAPRLPGAATRVAETVKTSGAQAMAGRIMQAGGKIIREPVKAPLRMVGDAVEAAGKRVSANAAGAADAATPVAPRGTPPAGSPPAAPAAAASAPAPQATAALTPQDAQIVQDLVRQGYQEADVLQELARLRAASPIPAMEAPAVAAPTPSEAAPRPKLNAAESKEFLRLVKAGKTPQQAWDAIDANRQLQQRLGTPSSETVRGSIADRNATGRWRDDE